MTSLAKYAKALAAGLAAGYAVYAALSGDGMTSNEWVQVAIAAIGGLGLTWLVPNAPNQPAEAPKAPAE